MDFWPSDKILILVILSVRFESSYTYNIKCKIWVSTQILWRLISLYNIKYKIWISIQILWRVISFKFL